MAKKKDAKKTDETDKKQSKPWLFKEGQSGNPKGRPKGARSKFSETFLRDLLAEWEEGGQETLKVVRLTDPAAFLRVAASLLPKEINVTEGESILERALENYDDDELDRLIAGLCKIGLSEQSAEGKNKKGTAKGTGSIH